MKDTRRRKEEEEGREQAQNLPLEPQGEVEETAAEGP